MDQNPSPTHDGRCDDAASLYDLCGECLAAYVAYLGEREAEQADA